MLQTYGYVGGEKKKESWGAFFLLWILIINEIASETQSNFLILSVKRVR